jgi:hypothetical protein
MTFEEYVRDMLASPQDGGQGLDPELVIFIAERNAKHFASVPDDIKAFVYETATRL